MPLRNSSVIIRSTKNSPLGPELNLQVGIFRGYARSGTVRVQVNGKVYVIPIENINDGNLR